MSWTGRLLIVLALLSLGCGRGDLTTETLTLVDVTGTWEGALLVRGASGGIYERTIRFVLQQNGPKVTGEVQGAGGEPIGSVEGRITGEVFNWQLTGPFVSNPQGSPPSQSYRGEANVNSDELSGTAIGLRCPCSFLLRRVGTQATNEKPQM